MQTTTEQSGDVRVLHLAGRLTADRHEQCLPDVVQELVKRGARRIVLDFKGISYMDSTCLGELIDAHRQVVERGGRLTMINVSPRIEHLLSLSGLAEVLIGQPIGGNGKSVHSAA